MSGRKSTFRTGHWLPAEPEVLQAWLHNFKTRADERKANRHPVIHAFADLIESDPIVRMYFASMIREVPKSSKYRARHAVLSGVVILGAAARAGLTGSM